MRIRDAAEKDLPAILAIYNQVVADTTAIYEDTPTTPEQRLSWFKARQAAKFPVLVADIGGEVAGFSSYGDWRARWGYRFTVEHSVHVRQDWRSRGVGKALVEALLPYAQAGGVHAMIGAIDAENRSSIRFHERLGFREAGRYPEVAFKFGRWLDLVTMQRFIDAPGSPRR